MPVIAHKFSREINLFGLGGGGHLQEARETVDDAADEKSERDNLVIAANRALALSGEVDGEGLAPAGSAIDRAGSGMCGRSRCIPQANSSCDFIASA